MIPFKIFNYIFHFLIRSYQILISPFLKKSCRYFPSCSSYALQAFENHFFLKAFFLVFIRIISCNSLSSGGYHPLNKK